MTPERLAALRARASRPRRTVPVVCNGDLAERIANLQDDLADLDRAPAAGDRRLASRANTVKAKELEAQLDALYAEAADDTILVVVEGLTGTAWDAMLAQHPPTPGEDGKPRPGFDAILDRKAAEIPLIRACIIGQRATVDSETVDPLPDDVIDWLLGAGDEPGFCTAEQKSSLFVAAFATSLGTDAVPLRRRRSTAPTSDGE